jgi:hypothetical protein
MVDYKRKPNTTATISSPVPPLGLHGRGRKRAYDDREPEMPVKRKMYSPHVENREVDVLDQLLARWTTISTS